MGYAYHDAALDEHNNDVNNSKLGISVKSPFSTKGFRLLFNQYHGMKDYHRNKSGMVL